MAEPLNVEIAQRFEEVAKLLAEQGANPFRLRAYERAAETLRRLDRSVDEILEQEGLEGLEALPTIGERLARAIRVMVRTGRYPMLERLRGEVAPEELLESIPGIGPVLAQRLHHDLDIHTLEDLELAAHSGRLAEIPGFGPRRIEGILDTLTSRLGRVRRTTLERRRKRPGPPVGEILNVDREYRRKADREELPTIAPKRFNPRGVAWLPILHTDRGERHYTALYSNTARAHQLGRTHDWVVIYYDGRDGTEGQSTVVTARRPGPLQGARIVRGREAECLEHYRRSV